MTTVANRHGPHLTGLNPTDLRVKRHRCRRAASGNTESTAAQALVKIVDADNPPIRVFFGPQGYQLVQQVYADRLKTWSDWQDLSLEAHGKLDQ